MTTQVNSRESHYNDVFPSRLRQLIEERHTTITALAKALGVSRQAVSQYQDGSTQPNVEKLKLIAEYFDCSADYLIGLSDVQTPDTNTKAISALTGLSENSISLFSNLKDLDNQYRTAGHNDRLLLPILDAILAHPEFNIFMGLVREFLVYRDIPNYGGFGTSVQDTQRGLVLIGSDEYSELCRIRAIETLQRILLDVWRNYQADEKKAKQIIQETVEIYKQLHNERRADSGTDNEAE